MFHFRLQKVLDLREKIEQERARTLLAAEQAAERARTQRDKLRELQQTSRAEFAAASDLSSRVGHLQQLGMVLSSLEERVDQAEEALSEAEGQALAARGEFELATRDRQILDRLKDRHEVEFQLAERHRDRVDMDEVAISRFTRTSGRNGRNLRSHESPASQQQDNEAGGLR